MQNFEMTVIVFAILIALLAVADILKLPGPVLLVIVGLSLDLSLHYPLFA